MNLNHLTTAFSQITHRVTLDGDVRDEVMAVLADILNYPKPGTPLAPLAPLPPAGSKPRIALCLGHGRSGDEGVDSVDKTSEEEFNYPLIERIAAELRKIGHDVLVVTYYEGNGYTAAMTWLAKRLEKSGATAAVEFHFNAGTGKSRGHEFLHWEESRKGVVLARCLLSAFNTAFPEHPSRGVKKLSAKDRGALFVSLTHCPACIAEPFFGDNQEEWHLFSSDEGIERLVDAYVGGITRFIQSQAA